MDADRLNRWLTLGANIGVLLGIALLVVELRQNQDVMRAQTRNDITQGELTLLLSTAENRELADIVVRANNGEELTQAEQLRSGLRSESTFRLWQNVHFQGRNGTYEEEEFRKHLDTMEQVLRGSRAFVGYWCRNSQIYPKQFQEEINNLVPIGSCQVQDGYAPVEDGRLYYQVSGYGDVVVLIHGNAGDHRHWNNQFNHLSTEHRVVRYDVRGYGKSSVPMVGSTYSDATDLAALLDFLDVETAHIVGWSFGSGVAFDFAASFPERTSSLISVGPWVNGHTSASVDDLLGQMGTVADAAREKGATAASNAFVDIVLGNTIFDDEARDLMRSVGAEYSWWAFTNASQTIPLEPSAASRLNELTMPILVMTAEHDLPVCREVGDLVADSAPNSTPSGSPWYRPPFAYRAA